MQNISKSVKNYPKYNLQIFAGNFDKFAGNFQHCRQSIFAGKLPASPMSKCDSNNWPIGVQKVPNDALLQIDSDKRILALMIAVDCLCFTNWKIFFREIKKYLISFQIMSYFLTVKFKWSQTYRWTTMSKTGMNLRQTFPKYVGKWWNPPTLGSLKVCCSS